MIDGSIFISYARRDGLTHAEKLETALQNIGYHTWRDKRTIDPATDFTAQIETAIKNASKVVTCITPDTMRDDSFVRREIQYALLCKKPVYVARFDDMTLPPISIVNHTWANFCQDWDVGFAQLCDMLAIPTSHKYSPVLTSRVSDPFRDYVGKLYQRSVDYLEAAVIKLIELDIEETSGAVLDQPLGMIDLLLLDTVTDKPFKHFPDAFAHFNQRLLLLGPAGAGKTVTLMHAVREAAAARLADEKAPLPLFGIISTWDSDQQPTLLDWLGTSDSFLSVDLIRPVLSDGKALLFLDGLDELGSERAAKREDKSVEERYDPRLRFLAALNSQLGNNRALVSCRDADYAFIANSARVALDGAVTLHPLSQVQIRHYLHAMPELLSAIEADPELQTIAQSPLLLSCFAFAFQNRSEQVNTLKDLEKEALSDAIFLAYMHRRYQREVVRLKKLKRPIPFTFEFIHNILGRLAMEKICGKYSVYDECFYYHDSVLRGSDFALILTTDQINPFISFCLELNYFQPKGDGTYDFAHLLLRDALACSFSLARLRDGDLYTKYHEPNPARALGRIGDRRALESLMVLITDKSALSIQRKFAIYTLDMFSDRPEVEPLIAILNDCGEDSSIRYDVANVLFFLNDKQVIEPLVEVLSNHANFLNLRYDAAEMLGKLNNKRTVEPLIAMLSDDSVTTSIRCNAATVLGELKDERAVEPLIAVLSNDSIATSIRGYAVIALAKLDTRWTTWAVEPLIAVLSDYNIPTSIRRYVAYVLGELKDERAVEPLISFLGIYENSGKSGEVGAWALKQIGTPRALKGVEIWHEILYQWEKDIDLEWWSYH